MPKSHHKDKILVISLDWNNVIKEKHDLFLNKLRRDRIDIDKSDILVVSYGAHSHFIKKGNVTSRQFKAFFGRIRVVYDLMLAYKVPIVLKQLTFSPKYIFIHSSPSLISVLVAKVLNKSKVIFFLGNIPSELKKKDSRLSLSYLYLRLCDYAFLRFVDHFFVISEVTKSYLGQYRINADRISLFSPDTISRDAKYIKEARTDRIRDKYNIPKDKKILLSVGRMEPEKALDRVIKVVGLINRNDYVLIIVGSGMQEEYLKQVAIKCGIENRVYFAGFVDRREIWNYYADSDAFILLSTSEGLGLVFWEAMFMCVPVIGSRVGGIKETIGSNQERGYYW